MRASKILFGVLTLCLMFSIISAINGPSARAADRLPIQQNGLDSELSTVLRQHGFSGGIEASLPQRLGRPLNPQLAELGQLLFFDSLLGLHDDNTCAGCHAPASGFGDSQSIAIGVQNDGFVGSQRRGPRNQRRAPSIINTAFYPKLMWNGRFVAKSGDPFDNSAGFAFPFPEGDALRFPAGDARFPTLLAAQAHIPSTELTEMAGFNGAATNPFFRDLPHLAQFDDGFGSRLPKDTNSSKVFQDPGFLNEEIRERVLDRLNRESDYVERFEDIFRVDHRRRFRVTFEMVGLAIAEFETALTFANAPIDRFARGELTAMTDAQKRGALLFFGRAGCVRCHAAGPETNEMFSDFQNHVLAVPQLAPLFGVGLGNVVFDGPGNDEDFGAEQATGNPDDRYAFRTSPLRNVSLQPAFFHNGAFRRLDAAIRHHLDAVESARSYSPTDAQVDLDLSRTGPIEPVLERLDPLLQQPLRLRPGEFEDLLAFVRDGLLDPRAEPVNTCGLVPSSVPSRLPLAIFEGCQ